MRGRHAEGELQAAHGHGLVAATGRALACGHHDVGAALAQRLPGAGERLAADAQARAAVEVLEGADVVVEGAGGDQRVVHQPQLGLESRRDLAHARFEVPGRHQQPAPFLEHLLPGRRERDAWAVAREQGKAQLFLEFADRIRDGGWHLVQLFGRAREGAVPRNGVHQFDGFEGQFQHGEAGEISIIEIIDYRAVDVSTYGPLSGEILSSPEHCAL